MGRIVLVFLAAAVILMLVFRLADRHAEDTVIPRYCDDPQRHLTLLREILTEERPAGDETRRPYIVAAKLLYLVPQEVEESNEAYLERVRVRIAEHCR